MCIHDLCRDARREETVLDALDALAAALQQDGQALQIAAHTPAPFPPFLPATYHDVQWTDGVVSVSYESHHQPIYYLLSCVPVFQCPSAPVPPQISFRIIKKLGKKSGQ